MRRHTLAALVAASILMMSASTLILVTSVRAGDPPCRDTVRAIAPENTIQVFHDQAERNCCATVAFDLVQAQDTLNLYESETFSVGPCHCNCCFDLSTSIENVEPGIYLVRVLDAVSGELFGEVSVTVEIGQFGQPALSPPSQSPCGGWAIGVEPTSTWGRIKALYF